MSNKDEQNQTAPQGIPPEWANQMPPPGYYGYPPVYSMMHPGYYHMMHQQMQAPPMHQCVPPGMLQGGDPTHMAHMHAYMSAMAAQGMPQGPQGMSGQTPGYQPPYGPQNQPQTHSQSIPPQNDPMLEQAQAMLEGALGEEQAGMFKELLGTIGMNDKEFWKGALVGAAAALVLSNENVRKSIMGLVSGTGDMLKSGGSSVKDTAVNTASSMKENVSAGSEIFRDTYQAGREGFKESIERHKPTQEPVESGVATETDPDVKDGATI